MLNDLLIEAHALKQNLELLLAPELGTFSDGQPAIWLGTVPNTVKTTGLQCTIQPVKEGATTPMSNSQVYADYSWVVELINFASAGDAKLAVAKRKIESRFQQSRQPKYTPATDLTLEQCKFYFFAPEVFNPLS